MTSSINAHFSFQGLERLFEDAQLNTNNNAMTSSTSTMASSEDTCSCASDVNMDTLTLARKTYVIKSRDSQQVIAFSGAKSYVITRTRGMYVIILNDSKRKRDDAAAFARGVARTFVERGFWRHDEQTNMELRSYEVLPQPPDSLDVQNQLKPYSEQSKDQLY